MDHEALLIDFAEFVEFKIEAAQVSDDVARYIRRTVAAQRRKLTRDLVNPLESDLAIRSLAAWSHPRAWRFHLQRAERLAAR